MDKSLFNSLVTSLNQAIAYERGDKSMGRSEIVTIPDDEISFYRTYRRLSDADKSKATAYVDELLQAASQ